MIGFFNSGRRDEQRISEQNSYNCIVSRLLIRRTYGNFSDD